MITKDIYAQANCEFQCEHEEVALRRRIVGEGARQQKAIWKQCLRCGKGLEAVKKHPLSSAAEGALEPYDEHAYAQWRAQWRDRVESLRATVQEGEQDDWWERYEAYLRTPEWARLRTAVLGRDKGVCQGCLGRSGLPATQAHHLTYVHLGQEFAWELTSVCLSCHERLHGRRLSAAAGPERAAVPILDDEVHEALWRPEVRA